MVTRRAFLATSVAAPIAGPLASGLQGREPQGQTQAQIQPRTQSRAMVLAMHQNTSRAAGFRGSLEGWSRAGIRYAELNDAMLGDFLETDTLAGAGRLLGDLGITPVSGAAVMQDLWIPGPAHQEALETWRTRCEQFAALGLELVYCPSITSRPVTTEDFAGTPECIREAGDIAVAHGLTAMIEFTRTSTHLATLGSSLEMIRAASHASVRPMLDFFHFFSGLSKTEDLELLQPGELAHAHFQDLADVPRELVDNSSRLIPGDGIAPVVPTLRTLAEKGYAGALSVELFRADYVNGDPYAVASEIRRKCEAVMAEAGVG